MPSASRVQHLNIQYMSQWVQKVLSNGYVVLNWMTPTHKTTTFHLLGGATD